MYDSTGYQTIRQNAPDLIIYETDASCADVLNQHGHLPKSKQHGPFLNNFKVERLGGGGIVVVREGSCHKFIQTQSEVSKNINMRQSEFFRGPFTVLLKQNFHSTPASHPRSFEHAQRILCTSCFSVEYACLPQ